MEAWCLEFGAGGCGSLVCRGAKNMSLEVEADQSKGKNAQIHVLSSEVRVTIASRKLGHSVPGRCPESIRDTERAGEVSGRRSAVLDSSEDPADMPAQWSGAVGGSRWRRGAGRRLVQVEEGCR